MLESFRNNCFTFVPILWISAHWKLDDWRPLLLSQSVSRKGTIGPPGHVVLLNFRKKCTSSAYFLPCKQSLLQSSKISLEEEGDSASFLDILCWACVKNSNVFGNQSHVTSNHKTTKPKQTVGIFSKNSGKHMTTKESFPLKVKIVQVFKLSFCSFYWKKLIGFSILAN